MPKATKLHPKGKTNTIQKPIKKEKELPDNADPEESMRQFQLELCWCIQQCERFLSEKKGTEKQMQETWKVLTVLKNNNQPTIRKRQLMRTHFGDYRAKMAAEEKKLAKLASKIKISETPDKPKATFLRKSAFLTTGDSSFRFNFDLNPQQIDSGNSSKATDGNGTENGSFDAGVGNTENADGDNNKNDANISKNDGNTSKNDGISNENDANQTKQSGNTENNSNKFKFSFSDSQFKFNFNVNP